MADLENNIAELHRVETDTKAVRVLLNGAVIKGDSKEIQRLLALLELLGRQACELRAKISAQRTGGEQ